MKEISNHELSNYGIDTKHHIMDNGELRFRLKGSDGSAYIRTEASADSGWQNSHYHTSIKELYLVQSGWILFAELFDDKIVIKKYMAEQFCITQPGVPHNVYLAPNTIMHTIKFGDCSQVDWQKSEKLDFMLNTFKFEVEDFDIEHIIELK